MIKLELSFFGGGSSGGDWAGDGGGGGNATNVTLAGEEVMQDVATALSRGASEFPEIADAVDVSDILEADFDGGVLGTFNRGTGEITLQRGLPSGGGQGTREWVAAHEVGHGMSTNPPPGFRTAEQTMAAATRQHNSGRTSGRLSQAGLARQISRYAGTSPREAVAEAFADWTINGNNSSRASQIIMSNWRD